MQFANMQFSGRLGRLAMADVRKMGTESKVFVPVPLTSEIKDALALLMVRMESGRPKILEVGPTQKPFVFFIDGAFEPSRQVGADGLGVATIGGVLFSPDGQARVFGCNVDASLLEQWLQEFQHPIGLIELYAVAVAYNLWGHLFSQRKIFFWGELGCKRCFHKGHIKRQSLAQLVART